MKNYQIISYVNDVASESRTYSTLEEARKAFPTREEVAEEMKKENRNAVIKFTDDDEYSYWLFENDEETGEFEIIDNVAVSWGEIRGE